MITPQQLDTYVGKSIAEICPNGYASLAESHGGHFVSHLFGYNFGVTCRMRGGGTADGATLLVREIFGKCPSVGVWGLRSAAIRTSTCLVFITRASNVNIAGKMMADGPREHVGIFTGGFIWHYSKRLGQVVRQTPSQFGRYYPAPDNSMFYGLLP